jgi:hypothetical protein
MRLINFNNPYPPQYFHVKIIRVRDKFGAIEVKVLFARNKPIRFLKPYRFVAPNLSRTHVIFKQKY